MRTAAIYVRISSDSDGRGEGVARQEADCRALAANRGYEVAEVYVENDTSASAKSRKPRPKYRAMVSRAARGEFDAIIAWKNDRLTRRLDEAGELFDLLDDRKRRGTELRLHTVKSGDHENTATGQGMAGMQAVWAAMEAAQTSERTQAAAKDRAERGRAHGRMTYGFAREDGIDVVDEEQAATLREAKERVLAGESLRAVAKDLTDREIPTPGYLVALRNYPRRVELARVEQKDPPPAPKPGAWDGNRLRQLLERPANAGLRLHDGVVVREGGAALWPKDVHEQLVALFGDPERRTARSTTLRYQLSGLLLCGKCGAAMYGETGKLYLQKRTGRTVRRADAYACKNPRCRGVRAQVPAVDLAVEAVVLGRLSAADVGDLRPDRADRVTELREEIAGARAELVNVADDYYVEKLIDRETFRTTTEKLKQKVSSAERALKAAAPSPAVGAFLASQVEAIETEWAATPVEARREVIRSLVERVELAPAGKGTRWTPARLRGTWVGGDEWPSVANS